MELNRIEENVGKERKHYPSVQKLLTKEKNETTGRNDSRSGLNKKEIINIYLVGESRRTY